MKSKPKITADTGTPSILINNKIVKVPAKISKSLDIYLDWLYNEYEKSDPNFNLTPKEFIDKLHELMLATWSKTK